MNRTASLSILSLAAALFAGNAQSAATVQDVDFFNDQGVKLTAKFFQPSGNGPFPAVVLMHGCSGFYSNSLNQVKQADGTYKEGAMMSLYKEWAQRLNNAGYSALVVNSFTPRGADENQCNNGSAGTSEVTDRPYDAAAAAQFLAAQPKVNPAKIALMGWSHGGSSTMTSLDSLSIPGNSLFKAAVAFYPGCGWFGGGSFGNPDASTWKPNAPLLVLHGDADALYTSGYCDNRIDAARLQGATIDLTVYPGAQHSFDLAKSTDSKWTQADLDAKADADPAAMLFLNNHL
jgi:dienelactone hydrolase